MLVALVLKRYLTLRSPRRIKPSSSTSPHLPCLYPLSSSLITRGKFYFPKHFAPAFFLMFLLEDFPELLCDSSHSLLSSSGEGNTGLYIYTCMISSVVVLNRHQEIREEWSQLGLKTRIGSYCYIIYVSCKPYWCFYNASRITFRLRLFLSRLFFIQDVFVPTRTDLTSTYLWFAETHVANFYSGNWVQWIVN